MKNQYLLLLALTLTISVNAQKKKNQQPINNSISQQLTTTSASERMKAFDQRKALEMKSLVNNVKFRSVGPTVMSGRVVDVDVNNQNPTEFFVAYASGGLW